MAKKRPEPIIPVICETCLFWHDVGIEGAQECRRRPPVAQGQRVGTWPLTKGRSWCGEWRERK